MTAIPDSLHKFIFDEEGRKSEAEILALVRQLQDSGRDNAAICRALYRVMVSVSLDLGMGDGLSFMLRTRDLLNDAITMTENSMDRLTGSLPLSQ